MNRLLYSVFKKTNVRSLLTNHSSPSIILDQYYYLVNYTKTISTCRTYSSLPKPQRKNIIDDRRPSTQWDEIIVQDDIIKETSKVSKVKNVLDASIINEKANNSIIDTSSSHDQPFCDPPLKNDSTIKENPQYIAILEPDLKPGEKLSLGKLLDYYTRLGKKNLTILVASTTAYGFIVAPLPISIPLLVCATVGTVLTSASANTVNQLLEIPYDAQMKRTKNRVLVLGQVSYKHAVGFAAVSLISGVGLLTFGCNTLTGLLGLINFLLYTAVYTPMKRIHIVNTWLGSIVGAIPPVMGWVASTGTIDSGALVLAYLLYAWQFPHFNSLSWNIRTEYGRAGYKMMCVSHERLCLITSLRYSIMITLCCSLLTPYIDMTTWLFAFDTLPINLYLIYLSYDFYKKQDSQSSRRLFRYSLIHLPLLLTLMVIHRKVKMSISPPSSSKGTAMNEENKILPIIVKNRM
ncbi:unnamed protein product [Didymodactylos carnosus]|uniref:Protoheme IX farnesyltransferase, mitochondrial n=1 Tax=Didymodactylos carnosus TaxID=1234261 RepID=A0A8S2I8Q6_9BILA|nr:unnamed protein product [Didymodactylos carnosus]CAF3730606.1 unnamed protein product [Didymodactylos carnosus]